MRFHISKNRFAARLAAIRPSKNMSAATAARSKRCPQFISTYQKIGSPRGSPPSAYQKISSPRPRRDKRCPQHDSTYQKIGSPRIPLRQAGSQRAALGIVWFFTSVSRQRHITPPLIRLLKNRFAAQFAAIRLSKNRFAATAARQATPAPPSRISKNRFAAHASAHTSRFDKTMF